MLSFGLTYYVCDLVGFVYPAYASFKALETKETGDDIQWLTYWVVYAIFMTLDVFVGELLGWIPLFYEIKLLFIIWMIVPQFKGAKVMYDNYIKPFLMKHASRFDPIFETTTKIIDNPAMGVAINMAQQYGPEVAAKALQMATENAASIAEDLKKKGTETSKSK